MKNYINILVIILVVLLIQSCNSDDSADKQAPETAFNLVTKGAEIVKSNNKFAFDFFREVAKQETKANYMVSPVSLSLALGMAYNGAAEDTKTAFANTLNYDDATLEEVNVVNKNIIDNLTYSSEGSLFEIANSLWINEDFPIKDEYVSLNKEYYYAESEELDFKNPASIDVINNWASDKTHEKIPSIINNISSDAVLFLINALYFNAKWKYEFDSGDNIMSPFYNSDMSESSPVEMMNMTADFQFTQNELFSSLILPYKEDKYSMVLMLPKQNKTTDNIINELDSEYWKNLQEQYDTQEVSVTMPKFKFDYKNELNDELKELGLGVAFTSAANFSGISNVKILISYVLQKTFIDVNEEGTEAAAVTIIGFETTAGGEPKYLEFKLDRPFIFVITEKETGSICFIGKVGTPTYE